MTKKAEIAEATPYAVNDYCNPEGQHRNYQRNVSSLPSNHATTGEDVNTSTISNPIMAVSTTVGDAHECEGARRLATINSRGELKRRKRKRENVMSL
jgi:hypothetical protein